MPNNEPKYTPGPWMFSNEGNKKDGPLWVIFPGYNETRIIQTCIAELSELREESSANARLICAAPELLEALKQISFECSDTPSQLSEAALGVIQMIAEAAIAKVEGIE
jgi:hypothetical protein